MSTISLAIDDSDFEYFRQQILSRCGIFLTAAKKDLLRSRLLPRLGALGLATLQDYRKHLSTLSGNSGEWQSFVNQMTTNKTDFFREAAHFRHVTNHFLSDWSKRHPSRKLRVWSAACSTGEEVYTLAMVLDRFFKGADRWEILGTDIDTHVIEKARNGVYPLDRLKDIPPEYLLRSVTKGRGEMKNWFRINDSLHAKVSFRQLNLTDQPLEVSMSPDMIFCRNVFIYFTPELIEQILAQFHSVAEPGALLFLGHSESFPQIKNPWKSIAPAVYQKASRKAAVTTKAAAPATKSGANATAVAPKATPDTAPAGAVRKKVLIVDDSKTMRDLLKKVLENDPRLHVVACVGDPTLTESAIREHAPDVMTLDIHMPKLDGCQVLERVIPRHRIPTVMISSISREESGEVLRALELGAVDYIKKPAWNELSTVASTIVEKVFDACSTKVRPTATWKVHPRANKSVTTSPHYKNVILIGSSTGGTEALKDVLTRMPEEIPPIVIVQHIPEMFSRTFAERLDSLCPFRVSEAVDGEALEANKVLVAPGGKQLALERDKKGSGKLIVRITDAPPVNRHKPSVDVLFDSGAELLRQHAIGVILTGMGADGAKGLLKMRQAGARTIAQDEASSVVYGMPREAARLGAAEKICPLLDVPAALVKLLGEMSIKSHDPQSPARRGH